jgi:hypothetical protein
MKNNLGLVVVRAWDVDGKGSSARSKIPKPDSSRVLLPPPMWNCCLSMGSRTEKVFPSGKSM